MLGGALMVSKGEELMAIRPSGFVTLMARSPAIAFDATVTFRITLVGLTKVTLLTVTPPPPSAAEIWLEKPGPPGSEPGSKNSVPETDEPVTVTLTELWPAVSMFGDALIGVAGKGARSC